MTYVYPNGVLNNGLAAALTTVEGIHHVDTDVVTMGTQGVVAEFMKHPGIRVEFSDLDGWGFSISDENVGLPIIQGPFLDEGANEINGDTIATNPEHAKIVVACALEVARAVADIDNVHEIDVTGFFENIHAFRDVGYEADPKNYLVIEKFGAAHFIKDDELCVAPLSSDDKTILWSDYCAVDFHNGVSTDEEADLLRTVEATLRAIA